MITPSEGGSLTSPDHSEIGSRPSHSGISIPEKSVCAEDVLAPKPAEEKPVKAAIVTSELDDNRLVLSNHLQISIIIFISRRLFYEVVGSDIYF